MFEIYKKWIPGFDRPFDAINGLYFREFFLICAKKFIPKNKHLAKVFVEVYVVHSMMHPVMWGGDDDLLKKAHSFDKSSMIPELHEELYRGYDSDHYGWYTEQCHGEKEDGKIAYKVREALTKSTSEIELLAAVMDDVTVPEEVDLMLQTMYPIAWKINTQIAEEI